MYYIGSVDGKGDLGLWIIHESNYSIFKFFHFKIVLHFDFYGVVFAILMNFLHFVGHNLCFSFSLRDFFFSLNIFYFSFFIQGSDCEYRHSEIARLNPRGCWYWLSGNCLNPTCAFRHPVSWCFFLIFFLFLFW